MIKDVQYKWAIDENGNPVHIEDAVKAGSYFCPGCESKFTLKDSGKTGPRSKQKHYSHSSNATCSGESYLHNMFIKRVAALLEEYQSEGKALNIDWTCNACSQKYTDFNLLSKTARIETEHPLDGYRPDIALLDAKAQVIAAIEIVYTHEPEEGVLSCYKEHGITLIQINVFFEDDLDRVEEKILRPNIVNLCLNHKCPNFGNHEAGRNLHFTAEICKHCGNQVPIPHVDANRVFGSISAALTEGEIKAAQTEGVRFIVKDKSLRVICPHCTPTKVKVKLIPTVTPPRYRGRRGPRL